MTFVHNVEEAGVDDIVVPIVASSVDAAASFERDVEFVFVDGAHDYASVQQDIAAWAPKLVAGGTIAFHDVVRGWDDTIRAVHDLVIESGEYDRVNFVHNIVYARKRKRRSRLAASSSRLRFWYKLEYDRLRPTIAYVRELPKALSVRIAALVQRGRSS